MLKKIAIGQTVVTGGSQFGKLVEEQKKLTAKLRYALAGIPKHKEVESGWELINRGTQVLSDYIKNKG